MSSALPVSRGPSIQSTTGGGSRRESAGEGVPSGMVTQRSVAKRVLGAWAGETERCCWGDGELLEDDGEGWTVVEVDGEDYVEERDAGGGDKVTRVTGPIDADVSAVRRVCMGVLLGSELAPLKDGLVCTSKAVPPGGHSSDHFSDGEGDDEGDEGDASESEESTHSVFEVRPMKATAPRLRYLGMKLRGMPLLSPRGTLCVAMPKVTPGGKFLLSLRSVDQQHEGPLVQADDVETLMPPGVGDHVPTRLHAALMLAPQTVGGGDGEEYVAGRETTLYRYLQRTSGGGWFDNVMVDRGQGRALLRDLAAVRAAAERGGRPRAGQMPSPPPIEYPEIAGTRPEGRMAGVPM